MSQNLYRFAVIGGTGLETLPPEYSITPRAVKTRFGEALLNIASTPRGELLFLSRHGAAHGTAPHEINYRANIAALADLGVTRILASNAVGSLRLDLPPESLVVLDDFLDFTRGRHLTLFDREDSVRHTDFSEPYCPQLREALLQAAADTDVDLLPRGTYACADGPRFETPAEIRMYSQLGGDIVGMTGIPEAVFAREAGICYAAVAIVTNYAAGLTEDRVDHAAVVERMKVSAGRVRDLFLLAASLTPPVRSCRCGSSVSVQPPSESV